MAITYGSDTGRRERDSFRTTEGELDCGTKIFIWTKNIQNSREIEDEYSICSIGVVMLDGVGGNPRTDICVQTASIRISEDVTPRYKPADYAKGKEPGELETLSNDGTASDVLACPIRVRRTEFELTCEYNGDTLVSSDDILLCETADGAYNLTDVAYIPAGLTFVLVDKTVDRPQDDFVSTTVTYRARLPYPADSPDREAYIDPVLTDFGIVTFDYTTSTIEMDGDLRQGETPRRRLVINTYGVTDLA